MGKTTGKATDGGKPKRPRFSGRTCCVLECRKNDGQHKGQVSFFCFPKLCPEQSGLWAKAVGRVNADGSEWTPGKYDYICSDHFVDGEASRTRGHPSYIPSIFPEKHRPVTKPDEPCSLDEACSQPDKPEVKKFGCASKEMGKTPSDGKPKRRRASGRYCCVVGCGKNYGLHKGQVRFFCFPKLSPQQSGLWVKAVGRVNADGSEWTPGKNDFICSDHFVDGQVSRTRGHPSYIPSIFPEEHPPVTKLDEPCSQPVELPVLKLDEPCSLPDKADVEKFECVSKEMGKTSSDGKPKRPRASGRYCCVVGCRKNDGLHKGQVRFFCFPKLNPEQSELWRKAVCRINADGSKWTPGKNDHVCSDHFVAGKPSRTRGDPAYVPSIFPEGHPSGSESNKPCFRPDGPGVKVEITVSNNEITTEDDVIQTVETDPLENFDCITFSCEHFVNPRSSSLLDAATQIG